ncbi:MAG: sodium:proton antiporter [Bacteroidota bacterium]|nr:sodium:proton antiporter [Bacteroidota bacterium]
MNAYHVLTVLVCLSALFAYLNQRFLKLPFVIGLFVLSTLLSLLVVSSKVWFPLSTEALKLTIQDLHIDQVILKGMLGFLLFAGALHTDWQDLRRQIHPIAVFAIGGVLLSTILIALFFKAATQLFHLEIDIIYCFLFGALISPTDPIAVLGILTKANVPKKTESIIVGESLFNDGVGVVVFIALLQTQETHVFSFGGFALLFLEEAVGGIAIGLAIGYLLHLLLKSIDHYESEILLTLAFVMAGYSISNSLHLSGALAMVVMGLMVGNFRQHIAMSDATQEYVHKFWELVDVILNAILFILIAFVLLVIDFSTSLVVLGCIGVLLVILVRFFVVFLPHWTLPRLLRLGKDDAKLISWGGLRGGLSLALVLSLPNSPAKELLLITTYLCVLFSITVQGLTIGGLAKKIAGKSGS